MNCYITSFSKEGYKEYGYDFLRGWITYAPKSAKLLVYHEGTDSVKEITDPRVQFINLLDDPDLNRFLADHTDEGQQGIFTDTDGNKTINYRFQATKFARKVFAYTRGQDHPLCDWLIWIDADVEIYKDMPEFTGEQHILAYYIGRTAWDHSECGFMAFNANHARFREFLGCMRQVYSRGDVFGLPEWHDSYVFDRVREAFAVENTEFGNIAEGIDEIHPWNKTFLGDFSRHNKGPLAKMEVEKRKKADKQIIQLMQGCMDRYEQVVRVIAQLKPQTIVEIGTWNGDRAITMATEALKHRSSVHYIGFDLFEEASSETDSAELNVKKHYSLNEVIKRLNDFKQSNPRFTYDLHKGNTRNTAHGRLKNETIDLAFIDGGHSVDTIKSDYAAVSHAKMVIFDDYYLSGQDTSKYGCNTIVAELSHLVLPVTDKFGDLEIAMVLAGRGLILGNQLKTERLDIKTKNCAEDEEIADNIRYSDRFTPIGLQNKIEKLTEELQNLTAITPIKELPAACHENGMRVVIIGGSPSWKDYLPLIRGYHDSSHQLIFATKTSHDDLIASGVVPFGCFLLDPRDHVESCMTNLHADVTYFTASMCHPTTWDRLTQAKAKVIRYHAGVHSGEDKVIAELGGGNLIFGGTSSGMRGMNLLYMMGFRNFELFGFDSSYATKPDKHHGRSPKPIIEVEVNGRKFISDPELVAQSKDIETFCKMMPDANVRIVGDGMLAWAVECLRKSDPGARNKVVPAIAPYESALQVNDDLQEAYWIDNAIAALKQRRKKIINLKKQLPSFMEFLNNGA